MSCWMSEFHIVDNHRICIPLTKDEDFGNDEMAIETKIRRQHPTRICVGVISPTIKEGHDTAHSCLLSITLLSKFSSL